MRKIVIICLMLFLVGCATDQSAMDQGQGEMVATDAVRGADAFNPWRQDKLPSSKRLSNDGRAIVQSMGGHAQSIQGEAAHRRHWREEVYPIVFGTPQSAHEVIVLLDFANQRSAGLWQEVVSASRSISPQAAKIVVFGQNSELYGTDLIGLMIWISHERKGQAMNFLTYALNRWNEVKAEQKSLGKLKPFKNEYDSTAKPSDFPIHYNYLSRLNPPVPESEELKLSRYNYDAGNVNMYQALQVSKYYGVKSVPAVIVDGELLDNPTAQSIVSALH